MKKKQNKKKEKYFFDKLAVTNSDYISLSNESYKKFFLILKKYLKLNKKKENLKILEIGCGTGAFTQELINIKNANIYAIDISKESVKILNKKYSNINTSIQDAENLSFDDKVFDVIVLSGVLHHFIDLKKIFSESLRVLKKKGIFFSYDPHLYNPFFWTFRRKKSFFYLKNGVTVNEEPLDEKKILKFSREFKFKKIIILKKSNFPYKKIHNSFLNIFIPIYNFIDKIISVTFFEKIIGSFIITIIKK